jgi:hypothetical protein
LEAAITIAGRARGQECSGAPEHPVLHSHGYLGVSDQSIFRPAALAATSWPDESRRRLVNVFAKKRPAQVEFTMTDAASRPEDVVAMLDQLLQ